MRYAVTILCLISGLFGCYLGYKLRPGPIVREVPVTVTKVETVTKEIVRQADGTVTERVVTQTKDETKASPQPKALPQYRVGALLPVASELRLPTVTASRRLFSSVWADAQYDPRHNEITIGVSVEF